MVRSFLADSEYHSSWKRTCAERLNNHQVTQLCLLLSQTICTMISNGLDGPLTSRIDFPYRSSKPEIHD
ncbi:hypothetical protein N9B43_04470 [Mariniblastus sp.]|nr:hypothetical protein [Mariniblastus sp.]